MAFEWLGDALSDAAGMEYARARLALQDALDQGRVDQNQFDGVWTAIDLAEAAGDDETALGIARWARTVDYYPTQDPLTGQSVNRAPGSSSGPVEDAKEAEQWVAGKVKSVVKGTAGLVSDVTPWWVPVVIVGVVVLAVWRKTE